MNTLLQSGLTAFFLLGFSNLEATEIDHQTSHEASIVSARILPLEVSINGVKSGTWLFLEKAGALSVQRDAFEEWRLINNPEIQAITFKGQQYLPLSGVPGSKTKVDLVNQSIELEFPPQFFVTTNLNEVTPEKNVLNAVLPSLFLNYDINYSKSFLRAAPNVQDLSALTEVGFSTGLGVLTNSASARNLTNDNALGPKSEWLRLETTFTRDMPEKNRSLWIGDTSTRSGMLGRNIYFGGIKYGTNFSLTPGYVSQPLPAITGLSAAPSTVELFINGVLRQTSSVPTGPFAIDNFPVLTGSGEARIVIRDLLGRQTVIQQSFFTNSQLLASGLNDWSVQAGSIRRDLGTANASYGHEFFSGLWRRGLNDGLTVEGRTALTSKLELLQLGAVSALPFNILGRSAMASSHDQRLGNGSQWMFGLEKQHLRYGAFFEAQGATRNFRDLGQDVETTPTKIQMAGNVNYTSEKLGTFGLGFANIQQHNQQEVTTFSGNYSQRIGKNSSLVLNMSEAKTNELSSRSIGLNFVISLDNNRVASVFANNSNAKKDLYATYTQNPDQNNPFGWRTLVGQQQNNSREEASAFYNGHHGSVSSEVSTTSDQTAIRIGANGGLIVADGNVFSTQRLVNSFAIAEVKGYGDIGVGIGSNMLTKTNSKGVALIPNLSAYQKNSIRLNAQDLPISADIDSIELDGIPRWRSGIKLSFPVRIGRGALLKITLDDGEVAPSGATVNIDGDAEVFYVARRGEAFVTGLQGTNQLILNWKDQQCKFAISLPPENPDEIPRVGPVICKGMTR